MINKKVLTEADVSLACNPLYMNDTLLLNPCGLIANSFFTGKCIILHNNYYFN
jgi:hypothetical protein